VLDAKHVREAVLDVGPNDIVFAGGCVGHDGNADEGSSCTEGLIVQVIICEWICHWTQANGRLGWTKMDVRERRRGRMGKRGRKVRARD